MTKRALHIFIIIFLASCSGNRLDIDVSNIKIKKVKIDRFEQDLFNPQTPAKDLKQQLEKKYGSFYNTCQSIISGSDGNDSSSTKSLNMFVQDSAMKEAYNDCQKIYLDLQWLQTDISDVYKHFNYYFPERNLPRVVTFMSGFNFSVLRVDSTIGIGLEMYLGSDNKFYSMLQFPKYKTMTMSKDYMVPDFARGWMTTEFSKDDKRKDFLNEIIYNGKLLYLIDALLPQVNDTIKIAYTLKQLEWCKRNEYSMWAYFVQKKILYISDPSEIIKYTGEVPFTSAFNKESPSRVGIWIGWQIVRSYMENNKKISLKDLMDEKDPQLILLKSKYKPGK